jgi:hypothetical protein
LPEARVDAFESAVGFVLEELPEVPPEVQLEVCDAWIGPAVEVGDRAGRVDALRLGRLLFAAVDRGEQRETVPAECVAFADEMFVKPDHLRRHVHHLATNGEALGRQRLAGLVVLDEQQRGLQHPVNRALLEHEDVRPARLVLQPLHDLLQLLVLGLHLAEALLGGVVPLVDVDAD